MEFLQEYRQVRKRLAKVPPDLVAGKAGVHVNTVIRVTKDKSYNPGIFTVAAIAGALDWTEKRAKT